MEFVKGSTIDFVEEMIRSSFSIINNPNVESGKNMIEFHATLQYYPSDHALYLLKLYDFAKFCCFDRLWLRCIFFSKIALQYTLG